MNPLSNNPGTPAWFDAGKITESLDAREMLKKGEHPLSTVLKGTTELAPGSIYELITSFVPVPLIEKVKAQGLEDFIRSVSGNEVRTYFYKK